MKTEISRRQLAADLARRCELPEGRARAVVGAVLEELGLALARGDGAELRGLGSFVCRPPRRRQVRALGGGGLSRVPAGPGVCFRPGRRLRQRLAELGRPPLAAAEPPPPPAGRGHGS